MGIVCWDLFKVFVGIPRLGVLERYMGSRHDDKSCSAFICGEVVVRALYGEGLVVLVLIGVEPGSGFLRRIEE